MNIHEAIKICSKYKTIVYPVNVGRVFYIEVKIKGQKNRYSKSIMQKEVNTAIIKTYLFYAEKYILLK